MEIGEMMNTLKKDSRLRRTAVLLSAGIIFTSPAAFAVFTSECHFRKHEQEEIWRELISLGVLEKVGEHLFYMNPQVRPVLMEEIEPRSWNRVHAIFAAEAESRINFDPQTAAEKYWRRQSLFSRAYHRMLAGSFEKGIKEMDYFAGSENPRIRRALVADLKKVLSDFQRLGGDYAQRVNSVIQMAEAGPQEPPVKQKQFLNRRF
ncbi:TPA: hypothetical protein DD449_03495 [Candidatus Berkelbacteria bacterium]|uniref:Uncharacterized protein n=1 Tax=Berkelbacteria bacterium GW2011_GWE1_39_12 TaxID=1618337 RepID=A0A0G4B3J1_9BACT|nr:MAG: hypothetical protein UT28_C0001G0331 [Berkelbacteria bacterium GW2011_GWE1_39_12]HBO60722.1 hypothetical protein [Candidatus Berkelbacteria bacterium]